VGNLLSTFLAVRSPERLPAPRRVS